MRTAIVYDRVNKWGGAERVLLALHELFPEAPLYTSVYHQKKAEWASVFPKVYTSFLDKISILQNKHELLAPLMPIAFESFNFDDYDLVISVTSEAAKGIITKPGTLHICYCLTPTRYLWSHYDEYFKGASFKAVAKPIVSYLRSWDKIAAQRPDVMIAISRAVQGRIKKYYNKGSEIIYPPVEIEKFEIRNPKFETNIKLQIPKHKQKKYYLIVSRLVPYKKVDLVVDAFNKLSYPLIIIGTGSEEKKIRRKAGKNIKFTGFVNEEELVGYYQGAKAFIFPQEEDFGITAVEAQAAGVPVIAYKAGGALDTIEEGYTGIFFREQTQESLTKAIEKFAQSSFEKKVLLKKAEEFSKERFKKGFIKLVEKSMSGQIQ